MLVGEGRVVVGGGAATTLSKLTCHWAVYWDVLTAKTDSS